MSGLTFERLFFVAVIARFILGPSRLPEYAHQLAQWVRTLRRYVETTHEAAERDLGVPLDRARWDQLDQRQYDPRRIVTDEMITEAERVRPGQRYLVTGTSSHPIRIRIDSLPQEDPRCIAGSSPAGAD
ncbi:MAG: preprotein translocase [Rhodococcus sp. (in: high G+C Gram-positive bacteria)]